MENLKSKNTISILDLADEYDGGDGNLELVRLDRNRQLVIPFTTDGEHCVLHFCEELETKGYVQCNGDDCVLCKTGYHQEKRILLPVYDPISQCIKVLPVSTSMRPQALLPQLRYILKANESDKPKIVSIVRNGGEYSVTSRVLEKDMDGGEEAITKFKENFDNGNVDLTTVYQRLSNKELSEKPKISRKLKIEGLLDE